MGDTTKAENLLNGMSTSGKLPPPPSIVQQGKSLPFSLHSSPQQAQAPASGAPAAAGAFKAKWIVVKDKCSSVLKTQGIAAAVVFVVVAGIMAAVNPPICQTKPKTPDEKPKRSVVKILVWATLAAALALVIPLGIEYAKKKKAVSVSSASNSVQ